MSALEYNSKRSDLTIPEYGRNIKKMVDYALSIEDREERNTIVHAIISVMGQLFPQLRDIEDFKHKLWDHLHIMSDFKLDVDSPYPKPSIEEVNSKPDIVPYPQNKIRYGHYGYVLEELIRVASERENPEEKEALTVMAANMMKKNYVNWNRNSVSDALILQQLKELSNGKLSLADDFELVPTNKIVIHNKPTKSRSKSNSGGKYQKKRPQNKRR